MNKKKPPASKIRERLSKIEAGEPLHYEPATARIINYRPKDNEKELTNFFKRLKKRADADPGWGMSKKVVVMNGHSMMSWINDSLDQFDDPRTQVAILLEIMDMIAEGIPDGVAQLIFFKCMGIERDGEE